MGVTVAKCLIGFTILVSLACMLLAAAAFTPAIGVSLFMLIVTGFIGYKGWLQSSIVLLLLNTFSIIISPSFNEASIDSLIYISILLVIAYGGTLIGARRLLSLAVVMKNTSKHDQKTSTQDNNEDQKNTRPSSF